MAEKETEFDIPCGVQFEFPGHWDDTNQKGLQMIQEFAEELEKLMSDGQNGPIEGRLSINEDLGRNPADYDYSVDGRITGKNSYIVTVKGAYEPDHELPRLVYKQGRAFEDFKGTCGLCSTANMARLLKTADVYEKDAIIIAKKHNLCYYERGDKYRNGGTTNVNRQKLAKYFGMDAVCDDEIDLPTVRKCLEDGGAVNFSVYAEYLRSPVPARLPSKVYANHSITLLELEYSKDKNELIGVYCLDTGGWIDNATGAGFISADKFRRMKNATKFMGNNRNYKAKGKKGEIEDEDEND